MKAFRPRSAYVSNTARAKTVATATTFTSDTKLTDRTSTSKRHLLNKSDRKLNATMVTSIDTPSYGGVPSQKTIIKKRTLSSTTRVTSGKANDQSSPEPVKSQL